VPEKREEDDDRDRNSQQPEQNVGHSVAPEVACVRNVQIPIRVAFRSWDSRSECSLLSFSTDAVSSQSTAEAALRVPDRSRSAAAAIIADPRGNAIPSRFCEIV